MAKVTTKVKPLGDRLLIRPEDREATTASGLVLPDTAKEKPQEGTVIAAGSGRVTEDGKTVPLEINEGDKVLYAKYAGTELRLDDEDLLIVSERDVLAIINYSRVMPGDPGNTGNIGDSLLQRLHCLRSMRLNFVQRHGRPSDYIFNRTIESKLVEKIS
mgnify:CR=1 FL=1